MLVAYNLQYVSMCEQRVRHKLELGWLTLKEVHSA